MCYQMLFYAKTVDMIRISGVFFVGNDKKLGNFLLIKVECEPKKCKKIVIVGPDQK